MTVLFLYFGDLFFNSFTTNIEYSRIEEMEGMGSKNGRSDT